MTINNTSFFDNPLLIIIRRGLTRYSYFIPLVIIIILGVFSSVVSLFLFHIQSISFSELGTYLSLVFILTLIWVVLSTYIYILQPPSLLILYNDRIILRRNEGKKKILAEIILDSSSRVDLILSSFIRNSQFGRLYGIIIQYNNNKIVVNTYNGWDLEDVRSLFNKLLPIINNKNISRGNGLKNYLDICKRDNLRIQI